MPIQLPEEDCGALLIEGRTGRLNGAGRTLLIGIVLFVHTGHFCCCARHVGWVSKRLIQMEVEVEDAIVGWDTSGWYI